MKNRSGVLVTLLVLFALVASGCGQSATPAPTATPEPTAAPTSAAPTAEGEQPSGDVEVAWEKITQPSADVLATVNGVPIGKDAYLAKLRQQLVAATNNYGLDWNDAETASYLPAFQDQVLAQMVNLELAKQFAAADGITVDDAAVQAEMADVKTSVVESGQYESWEQFLGLRGSTEQGFAEDVLEYLLYQALLKVHGGGSVEEEQIHAAHILVETEEVGREVLERLEAGELFSALAKEFSTDSASGQQGGDLGWFPRGVMVEEFEDAAFSMMPGETSGLVQSEFGYHIIQVLGRETRPLDESMLEQMQSQNFATWFADQAEKASVETLVTFEKAEE